jgi:hypothetical protein
LDRRINRGSQNEPTLDLRHAAANPWAAQAESDQNLRGVGVLVQQPGRCLPAGDVGAVQKRGPVKSERLANVFFLVAVALLVLPDYWRHRRW